MKNVLLFEMKKKKKAYLTEEKKSSSLYLKSDVRLTVFLYLRTGFY